MTQQQKRALVKLIESLSKNDMRAMGLTNWEVSDILALYVDLVGPAAFTGTAGMVDD